MSNFSYNWTLKDAVFTKDKGTVFSCFACGGGSTMGYKLAGFDVIGCNEIDPKMMEVYKTNHNPKYSFLEPIQTFKMRENLPPELFNLDILDGSPPCSSFSTSGNRDKDWGKEKKFREGQAKQVLDTLFFDFIDLAERLQPKVVVAENVKGLIIGKAKEYVREIYWAFDRAGYYAQLFLLDASKMGVPQKRERVFFIALRKDLADPFLESFNLLEMQPKLDLGFNSREIPFSEIEDSSDTKPNMPESVLKLWAKMGSLYGAVSQVHPKGSFFNEIKVCPTRPTNALTSKGKLYHPTIPRKLNTQEFCKASSFPLDYNFLQQDSFYVCGMSVPPVMVANIAEQIHEQWLSKINLRKSHF